MACHQMTYSMWHSPHVQDGHSNWRRRVWSAALLLQLRCISPSLCCSLARSFIRVTWLFHMSDMTLSYVWHDTFTWVVGEGSHISSVWHNSFTCVTCLIPMYAWRTSFICVTSLCARCARAGIRVLIYTRIRVRTYIHRAFTAERNRCRFRTTLPLEDPTPPHLPQIASSPQAIYTRVDRGTAHLHDFLAPFSCLFYRPISFYPLHNTY